MAKIKSYTDLEQSRKLVKILHLESADLHYSFDLDFEEFENVPTITEENDHFILFPKDIPCWSLSALLGVLPTINDEFEPQLHRSLDKYFCTYVGEEDSSGLWRVADNPVDACVEMIEKLYELKML